MTKRQIRRAEERRARKLSRKTAEVPTPVPTPSGIDETAIKEIAAPAQEPTPKPLFTEAKLEANRANARHSTGPRTAAGRSISARNNFRHGFAGMFTVLPGEDAEAFESFQLDLEVEHDPQSPTEELLVADMARHYWLTQRALRLQDELFAARDLNDPAVQKQLALYIRYQTTNQRAFHRCLSDLLKLRKEKQKEEHGFESQIRSEAREKRAGEMHELNKVLAEFRIATEDSRKFNLDFARMQAAGASDLSAVSKSALGAVA